MKRTLFAVLLLSGCSSFPYTWQNPEARGLETHHNSYVRTWGVEKRIECDYSIEVRDPEKNYSNLEHLSTFDTSGDFDGTMRPPKQRERFEAAIRNNVCRIGGTLVVVDRDENGRYLGGDVYR